MPAKNKSSAKSKSSATTHASAVADRLAEVQYEVGALKEQVTKLEADMRTVLDKLESYLQNNPSAKEVRALAGSQVFDDY